MKMEERKRRLPITAKGRVKPPTSYKAPPMTGPTISPGIGTIYFGNPPPHNSPMPKKSSIMANIDATLSGNSLRKKNIIIEYFF